MKKEERKTKSKEQVGKRRQELGRLRGLSQEDLLTAQKDLRQELFNLRLRQQTGSIEKPSRLRDIRKQVARIQTVLNEARPEQSEPAKAK